MAKQGGDIGKILVIGIIAVVAYFILTGGFGAGAEGDMSVGVRLYYKDGTIEEYLPVHGVQAKTFSVHKVTDGVPGAALSKVEWIVFGIPHYKGILIDVSAHDADGYLRLGKTGGALDDIDHLGVGDNLYVTGEPCTYIDYTTGTCPYLWAATYVCQDPVSLEDVSCQDWVLGTPSYDADWIEPYIAEYYTDYTLQWDTATFIDVTFVDAPAPITKTDTGVGQIIIQRQGAELVAFKVTVGYQNLP